MAWSPSVGMTARTEYANPPGGYGLMGRSMPYTQAPGVTRVSPYSAPQPAWGIGSAIAAEPMGPLPHSYGQPISPTMMPTSPSPVAQATPRTALAPTGPVGGIQPTNPAGNPPAAPLVGGTMAGAPSAPARAAVAQAAPFAAPIPGRPPPQPTGAQALSYDGAQPSGYFGADRIDMTSPLARTARLASLALPGPLGLIAGLARAGINSSNAAYASETRQAMGMEPLSIWQHLGAALGLNDYASGGDYSPIGRTEDGTPITYSGIAREPGGLFGLLAEGAKQNALLPAEYMAGQRSYVQPQQKTAIVTTRAGLPINRSDRGYQAAVADKASRGSTGAQGGQKTGGTHGGQKGGM